jgi:hypothetical protein
LSFEHLVKTVAKRNWTPEERAAWEADEREAAEARRRLVAWLDRYDRWLEQQRERVERRRRLVNRLSLGLLARR